jgi:ribonuclease BN (tRNA processing enzyme)
VRITVLGKSPSWPDAGGACSGYLVQEGDFTLLLDCGNGVFSKLRCVCDYVDVDAVLISHLHADHFMDLLPFSYGLTYAPRQQPVAVAGWAGTNTPARPHLYAPQGAAEMFRQITSLFGADDLVERAFHVHQYGSPDELHVGPFTIKLREVPHFTTTFAADLASNGSRFTYGADCGPNNALVELARDTDLLMIEATLPRPERTGERGHLTPSEAGEHGRRAGARRIVLTHYSDELDSEAALADAISTFGGEVEMARDGAVYTL